MVKKSKYKIIFSILARQIPWLSSFLLLALSFVARPVFNTKPTLVLIPIFFWAMHKTPSFDFIFVMLFGFIQDFMDGTQFGFNIFLFLSLYFMVYYQKFFPLDSSFAFSYLAFALSSLGLLLIKYIVIVNFFIANLSLFNIIISWAMLVLLYPLLYIVLQILNIRIVERYSA